MAQIALRRPDDRIKALGDTISELLSMDERRKRFAAMIFDVEVCGVAGAEPLERGFSSNGAVATETSRARPPQRERGGRGESGVPREATTLLVDMLECRAMPAAVGWVDVEKRRRELVGRIAACPVGSVAAPAAVRGE
jgi:hypothetical protein